MIFPSEIAPPKAIFGLVAAPKVTSVPIIIFASAPIGGDDYWYESNLWSSHESKNCLWGGNLWREDSTASGNLTGSGNIANVGVLFFRVYLFGGQPILFDSMVVNVPTVIPRHSFV